MEIHTAKLASLALSYLRQEEFMKATTGASLGNISLTVSIGGLIVTEIALGHELIVGPGWKVLL